MKWSRLVYLVMLAMIAFFIYAFVFWQSDIGETLQINQVAQMAQAGDVESIVVREDMLEVNLKDGTQRTARKESGADLIDTLRRLGVSSSNMESIKVEVAAPS
jgi:cell division protein FtsB